MTDAVNQYVATIGRVSIFDILRVPNWVPRLATLTDQSRRVMDDMFDLMIAAGATDHGLDRLEVRNNFLGFLFCQARNHGARPDLGALSLVLRPGRLGPRPSRDRRSSLRPRRHV